MQSQIFRVTKSVGRAMLTKHIVSDRLMYPDIRNITTYGVSYWTIIGGAIPCRRMYQFISSHVPINVVAYQFISSHVPIHVVVYQFISSHANSCHRMYQFMSSYTNSYRYKPIHIVTHQFISLHTNSYRRTSIHVVVYQFISSHANYVGCTNSSFFN